MQANLRIWSAIILGGITLAPSLSSAEYSLTDLGPGTGVAINGSGAVLRNSGSEAFLHQGTNVVSIVAVGGIGSSSPSLRARGLDINDGGVVLGFGEFNPSGEVQGFFWWTPTDSESLNTPAGLVRINRINSDGVAVGTTGYGTGAEGFPWSPSSGAFVPDLAYGFVPNGGTGELLDVNDAGVSVGYLSDGHTDHDRRYLTLRAGW